MGRAAGASLMGLAALASFNILQPEAAAPAASGEAVEAAVSYAEAELARAHAPAAR